MTGHERSFNLTLGEAHGVVQGEGNTVIQQFVTGIDQLPTRYDRRIANFLTEYLGRPGLPTPFGGRDADLERLDDWLDDETAAPCLLLYGTGGRGKSALLVHWSRRLLQRENTDVVFVPVSVRYRTNLPTVFFPALAARLAELYGDDPLPGADRSPEVWEGVVSDYLARRPPHARLVVVLDGLDEAADWELGPHLLPADPPVGLRVVVSARTTAQRSTGEDWLRALGWQHGGLGTVQRLEGISPDGIRDVLAALPPHPEDPADLDILVGQLKRLTQGDPLLLSEHLRDLLDEKGCLKRPTASFDELPAGLDGVFQRWWQDQRELWCIRYGALGAHGVEAQVNALMAVFARALGPLRKSDLAQLDHELVGVAAETALAALGRFLVGDNGRHGLVLSHSRLAEYWAAGRMTEAERLGKDARFASWGLETTRALNDGTLTATAAPPYTVQYLAVHLHRAHAPVDDWCALLSEGRQQAWLALEGTYAGFLADVHACRQALRRADARSTGTGGDLVHVVDDVLCALIVSSVADESREISAALLAALVRRGMWTPVQALVYARGMPRSVRAAALLAVAGEQDVPERRAVAVEALDAAVADMTRDSLTDTLPGAAALGAMEEAIEHAMAIAAFADRALACGRIVTLLPADRRAPFEDLAEAVLRTAEVASTYAIDDASGLAAALARLAPLLAERDRRVAQLVLGKLLPYLTPGAMAEVGEAVTDSFVPELLTLARATGSGAHLVNLISAVAARLPDGLRTELVTEAVAVALDGDRRSGDWLQWGPLAEKLNELTPLVPEDLHRRVVDIALSARDDVARGDCLMAVLPELAGAEHTAAVAAARALAPSMSRALALAAAVPRAAQAQSSVLAREALDIARGIGDLSGWADLVRFLAPVLPDDDLSALAQEALRKTVGLPCVVALCGIGCELAARGRAGHALLTARAIPDGHDRLAVLLSLSTEVAGEHREEVALEAVRTAATLGDAGFAHTVDRHVGHLAEQVALALMDRAQAVSHARLRSVALRVLLQPLTGPLADEARDAALACAAEASGSVRLFEALARLGHADEALATCNAMQLERRSYESVIAVVAPHLRAARVPEAYAQVVERAEKAARIWDRRNFDARARTVSAGDERPVPGAHVLRALARRAAQTGEVRFADRVEEYSRDVWGPKDWVRWILEVVPLLPEAEQRRWARAVPQLMARFSEADSLLEQVLRVFPPAVLEELYEQQASEGTLSATRLDLVGLATLTALLPEASKSEALAQVWQHVDAEDDTGLRLRALRALAPHLPSEQRLEACAALLAALTDDEAVPASLRGTTLRIAPLAPYMTQDQVQRFLALAGDWGPALDGPNLVALLMRLCRLTSPQAALDRADSLKQEGVVLQPEDEQALLVLIADSRTGDAGRPHLEQALARARTIGDEAAVVQVMARAAQLAAAGESPALVERCLRISRMLTDRAGPRQDIRSHDPPDPDLPHPHLPRDLDRLLEGLLPLLDHAGQRRLFDDVTRSYGAAFFDTRLGGRIIALMASTGHGEVALRTARSAPPGYNWDETAVTALAALPEELVEQAVHLAHSLARSDAEGLPIPLLSCLAARFAGRRREELTRQVLDITETSAAFPGNLAATLGLLPPLSHNALTRAQALAAHADGLDLEDMPSALAPSWTDADLLHVLDEPGSSSTPYDRLPVLEGVLPELCRRGRGDRAMEAFAELTETNVSIYQVLRELAPVAPIDYVPVLIEAVLDARRRENHSWLLAPLALRAPEASLRALERELPSLDGGVRVHLLASLTLRADGERARKLAQRTVEEAEDLVKISNHSWHLSKLPQDLAVVGDLLPPRLLADALLMAAAQLPSRDRDDTAVRQALDRLTAAAGRMRRAEQHEVLRRFLDGTPGLSRKVLLMALRGLAPVVASVGGTDAARRLCDALADVQSRWP